MRIRHEARALRALHLARARHFTQPRGPPRPQALRPLHGGVATESQLLPQDWLPRHVERGDLVDLRGGDVRGGQRTSLEPANLVLPSGARCKVAGLASAGAAKWNGHIGAIVEFDREVGRYVVQMTREEQLKIRPVNLVL